MKIAGTLPGGQMFGLFWILVSLGSCSIVQHIDNSSSSFFVLGAQQEQPHCAEFTRTVRLGHNKPKFPRVDIGNLSPSEANDVLLTYAERLKAYMREEDRFIEEDIHRYNDSCRKTTSEFFKKDLGYTMGTGAVYQLSKVQ